MIRTHHPLYPARWTTLTIAMTLTTAGRAKRAIITKPRSGISITSSAKF